MLGRLHRRRRSLSHNEDGVAVVEFAFAMPILVMFIWGISQFGMIMAADAGIQNALGEGARVATLFPTPDSTTINQRMTDSLFGQFLGSYTVTNSGVTDITQSTTSGGVTTTKVVGKCIDLNITYTVTPNFLFFNGPVITMPRSKRVYIST
ncbi:pilus assembly protein [Sphingomonas sp. KRR8]|uniref:TadE/TadG family type IV pilus assembly protein n=1 Tax=Sphingomonas sp. KRR8 TaxID=2942996 RepID=UPI0020214CBD|nr:TadE family protein [Sphingomonas sp. KRR8]URD62186.1 pilus assembly protein [Sphingomonas sp. KRR8]